MGAISARREYERLVRRLVLLRGKAATARRKMISRNRRHVEELEAKRWTASEKARLRAAMPHRYRRALERIRRTKAGRAALKAYELFWGIPYPPEILLSRKGRGRRLMIRVSLGTSPAVFVARRRGGRPKRIQGKRTLAFDPTSKTLMILNPKSKGPVGKKKVFIGYAPETHYIPTPAMERTGTFKKGKYWVHRHDDDGGTWPEVWLDSSGNFFYHGGTYRVGRWLRR